MEATQRRLRRLIPNAEERGDLRAILYRMSHEEVLPILEDDDVALVAFLRHLDRDGKVSAINRPPRQDGMEAPLEWERRLSEIIPNAEERGVLKVILVRMRPEEVLSIFNGDDDVVLASLKYLHEEATGESPLSRIELLGELLVTCCSPELTPEPTRSELLAPPAGERFCEAASSAHVWSAMKSFRELLRTFQNQHNRPAESVRSYLQSLIPILEAMLTAILGMRTAYYSHAHHH
ncbi:unnamed protein product [Sphagnum troendelagicum]|uniref:Uncharacterized protein n=1 Tax=Sphagnum troendelagicum TaxID=128251 RepID=A0ABP0UEL8_9BRYO